MHTTPHTDEAKDRISASQRARHAERRDERRRDDDYLAVRQAVFSLESAPGDFHDSLVLLYAAAEQLATHPVDRGRWTKRLQIAAKGRRVRIMRAEAEVFAGKDLEDLDRIRAATTPADLVGPEEENKP